MNSFQTVPISGYPLTAPEILINIGLAFILGLVVTGVYRLTNRNVAMNLSFFITLIMLSMIVALVMMVIGNSIARAFSLVGALSIIRFRTVVKDNRDIAYVFFSLAAGMAAGVGNYPLAIYGIGFISLSLLALDFVRYGVARRGLYLLRYQMVVSEMESDRIEPLLKKYLATYRKIAVKTVRMGQFVEASFIVRLKREQQLQAFVSELSALEGMERVNMIADEEQPDD